MPVPTRPSTGGPIESSWGQEAHDGVFTPSGGRWGGGAASGSLVNMNLTQTDDPDDWLGGPAGTFLTVPVDGDGLLLVHVVATLTVAANVAATIRIVHEGATYDDTRELVTAGGYSVMAAFPVRAAAGDTISVQGIGAGAFSAACQALNVTRLGRAVGLA